MIVELHFRVIVIARFGTICFAEYFQRALQQHFSEQQRMNANAGALQDVYRQYAAAGMMPQPMLVRTGVPQMAQMSQQSNAPSSSQPSSHSHQSSNAQSSHNSGSSHPNDGSQRVSPLRPVSRTCVHMFHLISTVCCVQVDSSLAFHAPAYSARA